MLGHYDIMITNLLNDVSDKKEKKWLDLSNADLTPASQAERWIKKINNSKKKLCLYYLYNKL